MGLPNGEIGEIAHKAKISDRSRDTYEQRAIPSRHDQVRVREHVRHDAAVIDRPAFPKGRRSVQFDYLVEVQVVAVAVINFAHTIS
jgi:hypothetical protein